MADQNKKLSDEELSVKYADQFVWLEATRDYEGWKDDAFTRKAILAGLIKKAFEERDP